MNLYPISDSNYARLVSNPNHQVYPSKQSSKNSNKCLKRYAEPILNILAMKELAHLFWKQLSMIIGKILFSSRFGSLQLEDKPTKGPADLTTTKDIQLSLIDGFD